MSTKDIIKAALFAPTARGWGLPIIVWGAPGVAKSDITESIASEYAMPLEILSPGERGEGAFGAIPVPAQTKDGMAMTYPPPDWAVRMTAANCGIVFADELTTAPPVIQPALLGLIHAKRIGATQLPPRVRIVAAANPPEQAAAGWPLPPPVANRLGHVQWEAPSHEAWTAWLLGNGHATEATSSCEAEERRVMAVWDSAYAAAKGKVAAFIRNRPSLLHAMPSLDNPQASRAWPSHRSWDNATRALAAAQVHHLGETDTDAFVAGFIGDGAYAELLAFSKSFDLPDPTQVLDGKIKWEHNPRRLDMTFAVLSGCAAALLATPASATFDARSDRFWDLVGAIGTDYADLVVPALMSVRLSPAIKSKKATGVLKDYLPILKRAGFGS